MLATYCKYEKLELHVFAKMQIATGLCVYKKNFLTDEAVKALPNEDFIEALFLITSKLGCTKHLNISTILHDLYVFLFCR